MQCNCMMGVFPAISRAWLTIDSDIFMWNYEDGYVFKVCLLWCDWNSYNLYCSFAASVLLIRSFLVYLFSCGIWVSVSQYEYQSLGMLKHGFRFRSSEFSFVSSSQVMLLAFSTTLFVYFLC